MARNRIRATTVIVCVALVATACSKAQDRPDRGASGQVSAKASVALADLPPLDPPADDGSPRGLVGVPWATSLPITKDANASDVGTVGAVQAVLPAATGTNPTYTVRDEVTGSDTPVYKGSSPTVPAGKLRNGGTYSVEVETTEGVRGPYTFTVTAGSQAAGAFDAGVPPENVTTGAGSMGIGITFDTADIGTTKDLEATNGLREGLPAGWQWQGLGSGLSEIVVIDSDDFQGSKKVAIISREGGGSVVLGCNDSNGWGCSPLSGAPDGQGLQAVLSDDKASTVAVTDPGTGQTWTFETWSAPAPDDSGDKLNRREGRVTSLTGPGQPRLTYGYDAAKSEQVSDVSWEVGPAGKPLTWHVFRAGDADCAGPTPTGFVAVPSGHVCGWSMPNGAWVRLLYVDTKGDVGPEIGRVMRLPSTCKVGDYTACQDDWQQVGVTDWAWSSTGHVRKMRTPMVAQAVMAEGASNVAADQIVQVSYDDKGRVSKLVAPAPVQGGPAATTTQAYPDPSPSTYPGATHLMTSTVASPGAGSQVAETAVDDGLRTVGTKDVSGSVTRYVWHPSRNLQLARLSDDGQATTQTFDVYDRTTGSFTGPTSMVPAGCAPGSPTVTFTSCAPTGDLTQVSGSQTIYDQGIDGGLIASWYGNPSFGGSPVATTKIDSFDSGQGGLVIAPPTGDAAKAIAGGGSVRITGALAPADGAVPSELTIDATGGKVSSGSAFVNGNYYSGFTTAGSASLTLEEDGKVLPYRLRVDLSFASAPTLLIIGDPDDGAGGSTYDIGDTLQRWGAESEQRTVETQPMGSTNFVASSLRTSYTDAASKIATQVETVPCGSAGSLGDALKKCAKAPAAWSTTRSFEDDGYGGRRLHTETSPQKNTTTYTYWGRGDTPGAASLPSSSEIPASLANVPQLGLVRSVESEDGRTLTTVYDEVGQGTCSSASTGGSGHWSCSQRDELGRPTHQVFRSADDGVAATSVDFTYTSGGSQAAHTSQKVRSTGGKTETTEVTSMDASGTVTGYELSLAGGPTAATSYQVDGLSRPTKVTTTITTDKGKDTLTREQGYSGVGLLDSMSLDGAQVAKARPDGSQPWIIRGWDYPKAGASNTITYGPAVRPTARNWTLAGGDTVEDSLTLTSGGRLLGGVLDGVRSTYAYDATGRITSATTGTKTTDYGFDDDGSMVCVARDLPAPGTCAKDPGAVTNTFTKGVLTATTDPESKLPPAADRYTANGNLRGVGEAEMTYDGYEEVSKVVVGKDTTVIDRDATGRIVAFRQAEGGDGTELLYASTDSDTPIATVAPDGSVQFAVALPGGLLWRSTGMDLTSLQGNPSVALKADGTRDTSSPTRRFGPYGEDLTPKPTAPPPATTTTTTAPPASTTTTAPPTTTTAADSATTTTTDAGATTTSSDGSSTTTSEAASTTTTSEATTTTTQATTTTTTAPAGAAAVPDEQIWNWNQRIAEVDGLLNLGRRTMVPRLGMFTSPDPVPGGSCTPYGYTCGDPINDSDLPGTMSWLVGAAIATVVAIAFTIAAPIAIGALASLFSASAGLYAATITTVVAGTASGALSLGIEDAINGTTHGASAFGWAILLGFVNSVITAGVGLYLSRLTYFEGELVTSEVGYAYGAQQMAEGEGVDGYGLYDRVRYAGYKLTNPLRRFQMWRQRALLSDAEKAGYEELKNNTSRIGRYTKAITVILKGTEAALHKYLGWFSE